MQIGILTPRQLQVALAYAHGQELAAIAAALCISHKTVATHLEQARLRLGIPPGRSGGRLLCFELGRWAAGEESNGVRI